MSNQINQKKHCYFCINRIDEIDYKDVAMLKGFINFHNKILPAKRTGTCSWHQRKLAQAIKRARVVALLRFTRT